MFHNGLLDDKADCQVLDQSGAYGARVPTLVSTDSGFVTVTAPRFYGGILPSMFNNYTQVIACIHIWKKGKERTSSHIERPLVHRRACSHVHTTLHGTSYACKGALK